VFKKNQFLITSLLAHVIVIFIVSRSILSPTIKTLPKIQTVPIQATLVFEVFKQQKTPQTPAAPARPIAPQQVHQKPLAAKEPVSVPSDIVIPSDISAQNVDNVSVEENTNLIKETEKLPSVEIKGAYTTLAKKHLYGFQQQQQNKLAAQGAKDYQINKNSPMIDYQVKDPFLSKDEKFRDKLKVRVDCSSISKKTAVMILGFLGGQLDCSKPPPFNSFIKSRLNKESHLPAIYAKKAPKRPQSVVIKE
jgi:hypothetical protein